MKVSLQFVRRFLWLKASSKQIHRNPEMSKTVRVHVTHDETKRIVSLQKGGDIQGLRHTFLQLFSDVLSSHIAPAHVKFQRYDDKFEDYVEIPNDERVDDDMKVRALVKQPHHWPHFHWEMPWMNCTDAIETGWHPVVPGAPIFQRPHQIKNKTSYQLWSPVSRQKDGLVQRDPKSNIVGCSGSFNSALNAVITATDETWQRTFYVALIFRDPGAKKDYAITGNGLEKDITATEIQPGGGPPDDKSVFEPLYYWSYTMFRNKYYNTPDLYLGCDYTGKATLVKIGDLDYPNPQALFILNKFVLI